MVDVVPVAAGFLCSECTLKPRYIATLRMCNRRAVCCLAASGNVVCCASACSACSRTAQLAVTSVLRQALQPAQALARRPIWTPPQEAAPPLSPLLQLPQTGEMPQQRQMLQSVVRQLPRLQLRRRSQPQMRYNSRLLGSRPSTSATPALAPAGGPAQRSYTLAARA